MPLAEHLSRNEQAVLAVLKAESGRVVSRRELARRANISGHERRCDSLIAGVRRVVGQHRIVTVRRRGWMLVEEASAWSELLAHELVTK